MLDISSNEKDALDGKLQQLNRILEKEVRQMIVQTCRNDSSYTQVKVLEEQSRKLASGTLGKNCQEIIR